MKVTNDNRTYIAKSSKNIQQSSKQENDFSISHLLLPAFPPSPAPAYHTTAHPSPPPQTTKPHYHYVQHNTTSHQTPPHHTTPHHTTPHHTTPHHTTPHHHTTPSQQCTTSTIDSFTERINFNLGGIHLQEE